MEYDNPAERLLSLLQTCKSIPTNTNCREAWQQVLNTGTDNALLMSRLGKVMDLPRVAVEALRDSFPNRAATWNHWNAQVNNAFNSQNMHANWDSFINHIDAHSINYLQMSSDLLQSKATTRLLDDEQIQSVRQELNQLYEEVLASSLNEDIKQYLVRNLRKLIASLDEYRITGALPILEAVESIVGHAHVDRGFWSFLKDDALGARIAESIGAMANLVTVAITLPQLAQIRQMLP